MGGMEIHSLIWSFLKDANMDGSDVCSGRGGKIHTEHSSRAVLLPRLQIKPHTGPLLRQLLQDGREITRQAARQNSCTTSCERETGAAANIWPQARRTSLELMVTCRRHGKIQEEALVQKAADRRDKKTVGYRDFHCPSLAFVVFKP